MHKLKLNKVAKNASWIIGGKIAQSIFALVISMITARYLGPENFGLINYAASVVAFVIPLMQLGITNVLVQEVVDSPQHEGEILGTSLFLCGCSSLLCIVGVVAFASIVNAGETETIIVCALYSILLFFQALEIIIYWFQAKYLSKYSSIISFFVYLIVSAYKIFLLASGKSVYWFAISNALDYMLVSFGSWILYKRLGGQKLYISVQTGKRLFQKSRYYILSNLMIVVFAQTDKIMLKLMLGSEYTGYYSVAITCAGMMSFIFSAIIDSMRPYVLEGKQIAQKAFENRVIKLYSIIVYLAMGVSIGITIFAGIMVQLLYGIDYIAAVPALRIVVWYTTFSYFGGAKDVWILAEGKQRYLIYLNLAGAVANVILNYALISPFGIVGAAVASLITQFFTNIVMMMIINPLRPNIRLLISGLNPKVLTDLLVRKGE